MRRKTSVLDLKQIADLAEKAVKEAGRAVLDEWAAYRSNVSTKGRTDIVSAADLRSEEIICSFIHSAFADHRILSEEDIRSHGHDYSGPLWVVDPIDGTANYVRGHPYFGISVAFAVDGVVLVGCVHAPALNETFRSTKGGGATMNGTPIGASSPAGLLKAVVSTGFPHEKSNFEALNRRVDTLLRNCQDIRRSASPVLDICYVGMGRLDAHTESLFPWDVAAAGLVACEAGAVRSHILPVADGRPVDLWGESVLFSAPEIHQELLSLLLPPRTEHGVF
jgi:myo-inositol-1(or 4)-monophosphatase